VPATREQGQEIRWQCAAACTDIGIDPMQRHSRMLKRDLRRALVAVLVDRGEQSRCLLGSVISLD
jgi:hypothetical protein